MTTVHPYIHLQTKANSKNINKLNSKSSKTSISCNENKLFLSTNKLYKPTYLKGMPRASGRGLYCLCRVNKMYSVNLKFPGITAANIISYYFWNFESFFLDVCWRVVGYLVLLRCVVVVLLMLRVVVRWRGDVHVAGSAERWRGAAVERRLLVVLRKRSIRQIQKDYKKKLGTGCRKSRE